MAAMAEPVTPLIDPGTPSNEVQPVPRRRLTHAERSASTRAALLEATIDCLAELGFAHTSTNEITRRAGVSRGAQVHHYPTKTDLVVAAVRHLFEKRTGEFIEHFDALPEAQRTLANGIDLLWAEVQGTTFRAAIELAVAGLTDPELKPVVVDVITDFERTIGDHFAARFPQVAGSPFGATPMIFAFRLLESAALYRELGMVASAEEMVGALRVLSVMLAPSLTVIDEPAPAEPAPAEPEPAEPRTAPAERAEGTDHA